MTLGNKLEKSNKLLNIFCASKNGYKFLVHGLRKACQIGGLRILNVPIHFESTQHDIFGSSLSQFDQMQISISNDSATCAFKKIPFQSKEAPELFTGCHEELDALLENRQKKKLAKTFLHKLHENAYRSISNKLS